MYPLYKRADVSLSADLLAIHLLVQRLQRIPEAASIAADLQHYLENIAHNIAPHIDLSSGEDLHVDLPTRLPPLEKTNVSRPPVVAAIAIPLFAFKR